MFKKLSLIICMCFIAIPAFAYQSDWVEGEGGAMRLVVTDDGQSPARGVLEIMLQPGWKTYWREPGDGGIPPALSINGSPVELQFPAPQRFEENGQVFNGYHSGISLPFTLPETAGTLDKLTAFIGVCREICVPFQAEFPLIRDNADAQQVDAAFAKLPKQASSGEGVSQVKREAETLFVRANSQGEELFLAPERGVYFGVPAASDVGFSVKILKEKTPGLKVNYTLVTSTGAVSGIFEMPK